MTRASFRWALAGLVGVVVVYAAEAEAMQARGNGGEAEAARRIVQAYVLRGIDQAVVDPFGAEGRREAFQLLETGTPSRGQFARVRLDRGGPEAGAVNGEAESAEERGLYEIRDDVIVFYYMDERGATGRVERGRVHGGWICLVDDETGESLAFEHLAPEGSESAPPAQEGASGLEGASPTGGSAPVTAACRAPGAP